MKKLNFAIVVLAILFVFNCSGQSTSKQGFQIQIPDTLNQEAKNIVMKAWPKVKTLCPGLDKYSAVLKFEGIEENFSYAPPDAQEVTIKLLVPEDNKEIPVEYHASGHHCFLGVSRNGKSLVISKNPCKSVVLDKNVRGTQYEAEALVLALQ